MTYPTYELTLGKTYYEKGFFNLGIAVDRYVQSKDGPITVYLGDSGMKLTGRSDRKANQNGTPRIHCGVELVNWFMKNFEVMDVIDVVILDKSKIKLRRKSS